MSAVSKMLQRLPSVAVVLCFASLTAACATRDVRHIRNANPDIEQALADLAHPQAPTLLGATDGHVGKYILDGAMLNGLGTRDIQLVLGKPSRIRKDSPAQVWQYDLRACFVDVFFYNEDQNDRMTDLSGYGPRVVYVQERARQVKKVSPGLCLNQVWENQRHRRLGAGVSHASMNNLNQ